MITEISIRGFKSLKQVKLRLGNLNLFLGTNASGKSNFLDALRVLQGIGYGYTIDEVFNGKPKGANGEVWEPIRGGSIKAGFIRTTEAGVNPPPLRVKITVTLRPRATRKAFRYDVDISPRWGCLCGESLHVGKSPVFDSTPIEGNSPKRPVFKVRYYAGTRGRQPHLQFEKSKPVLHQLLRHKSCTAEHGEHLRTCIAELTNMQRLDPSPAVLKEYSKAQFVQRMGERGENFAALVNSILRDPAAKSAYLSWLQQLTPAEVEEILIARGALDEPLFALKERGETFLAPVLSDGTLRFAAIAAALFQPDPPGVLTIEEIENGVHPTRLRLLVELLKSQAGNTGPQIMATTHSPIVLSWLKRSDCKSVFLCKRDEHSRASLIRPLDDVPSLLTLARSQPIGDLFAEGWLEGAL